MFQHRKVQYSGVNKLHVLEQVISELRKEKKTCLGDKTPKEEEETLTYFKKIFTDRVIEKE
ncbi:hypothetical protein Phum_PHUM199350 [Pediculus humanus corporis]|uniref:Uncharacterized protein n=1 Tax=Pediculus humanus subsp. corporis TaxID=121224 RepID=E0VH25_PEDHC|nr:uncharacterized protein Phum_PHUM199350 [Pediculus humanus corporis]EEB12681.1 hypothetical protein Phum_PHUM199350 [Pediculus humanus corporis]